MTDPKVPPRPDMSVTNGPTLRIEGLTLKIVLFVAGVLLVVSSVSAAVDGALIRQSQTQNRPTVQGTAYLVHLVQDCVTPGGKCFKQTLKAQQRNSDTTDKRNREVSAAAAACVVTLSATGDATYRKILHCVQTTLVIGPHSQ